jgi:hypothetical protein
VGFVVADVVIVYRSQALYGDVLTIEVCAEDFNEYGCDFYFRVTRPGERPEVLRAKTGIVCFDYRAQVKRPIPAARAGGTGDGSVFIGHNRIAPRHTPAARPAATHGSGRAAEA